MTPVTRFLGLIALWISVCIPAAGFAAPPSPFVAVYDAKSKGFLVGSVQLEFRREASGEYIYRQVSGTQGLGSLFSSNDLTETSRLRFEKKRLFPIEYRSFRKGGDNEENAHFVFDRPTETILSIGAGENWSLPFAPGIIDPLMVRLALMVDLAEGARHFEYQVPRQKQLKTYTFRVVGREKVTIGQKIYDTVKVARTDDKRDQTWLWHAPSLGYLPVRILKDKKRGADTEVILREVTVSPMAAPEPAPDPPPPELPSFKPQAKTKTAPPTPQKSNAGPKTETKTVIKAKTKVSPKLISKPAFIPPPPPKPATAPLDPAPAPAPPSPPAFIPDPVAPAARASPPQNEGVPQCPAPRRIGKSWHWVRSPVGSRCIGRLALLGMTSSSSAASSIAPSRP